MEALTVTRKAARITHDEVRRMVKAVQSCGLPVGQIVFNGDEVRVVINSEAGVKISQDAEQEEQGYL